MTKKTVYYDDSKQYTIGSIGQLSFVYTVDHPDTSNRSVVVTTSVVAIDGLIFETKNTIYKPVSELLKTL